MNTAWASMRIALMVALILAVPSSARAGDAAVLLGLTSVNGGGPGISWLIGHAPSVAGFEIEYLGIWGGKAADRSTAGGILMNAIVHPKEVGNLQFFAIFGVGMWGESFAEGGGTGAFIAKDVGGGTKLRITDHLRLRLDYRLFLLGDAPDATRLPSTMRPQRISAGLHVAF